MKKGLKPGKRKRRQRHRLSDKDIGFLIGGLAGYLFSGIVDIVEVVEDEEKKEKPVEVEFEIVEDEP
jgi:hypothetical protein